ncbi:hypothetical protein [Actinoplanes sp. NPDC051411]|uniref:P-loop NTPase n=1 Tax=Actinoplanes sp. NPDC051411 TaxID=3155522 RepID=UPI00341C8EFF
MDTGEQSTSGDARYSVEAPHADGLYTGDGGTQHNHFYANRGLDPDEAADLVGHIAEALQPRPAESSSPLVGWVRITEQFLAKKKPRADLAEYFDGLAPDWRDVCHPELRPRPVVKKVLKAFELNDLEDRSILVRIGGATGDGKSTVLLQAIRLLAEENYFDAIYWRSAAEARLTPDNLAKMRESRTTILIASDDAEALLTDIDRLAGSKLHEEGLFLHFLLASRDVDWNGERDLLGWKFSTADRWAPSFRVLPPLPLDRVDQADAQIVAENWVNCSLSRPTRLATGNVKQISQDMLDASRATEGRQAFMGGLLAMRFDSERLRSRLTSLLSRLAVIHPGGSSMSLAEFLVVLAVVDLSGLEGVPRDIAARFLGVPVSDLRPLVEAPMKREFFVSTSSRAFFARHPSISKGMLELALTEESNLQVESSLEKFLGDVQYVGGVNGFRGGFGKLKDIGRRLMSSNLSRDLTGPLALQLCRTVCAIAPQDLNSFIALSGVLRDLGQSQAALTEVWEIHATRLDDSAQWGQHVSQTRGAWKEMAAALGTSGYWWPAYWAAQVSISDRLTPKLNPEDVIVSMSLLALNAKRVYEQGIEQDSLRPLLTQAAALTCMPGSPFYDEEQYPSRSRESLGIDPREFGGADALVTALLQASRALGNSQPSLLWCDRLADYKDKSFIALMELIERLVR